MEPADPDLRLKRALEQAADMKPLPSWYRREWRYWPAGWQIGSIGACIGLVALALGRGPSLALTSRVTGGGLASTEAVTSQVEPTVAALLVLWRVVFEPLVPAVVAVVVVMVLACVAIGLMLHYVVLGRTWKR